MIFKVSISNDISVPIYPLSSCLHDYLGPPGPPPVGVAYVAIGVAVDSPTPMFWPPGMAMGQNKLTTKVLHKGLPICVSGHDVGTAIIHVQIAPSPANIMTALHILFSSRKSMFMASTVLQEGKPTVACTLINLPPAPMLACADPVPIPMTGAPTSHLNTLLFGMTGTDYALGWASIALEMVVGFIASKIPGPNPSGSAASQIMKKLAGPSGLGSWALSQVAGVGSGVLRMIFTDGPAAFTIGVGTPFLQVQVELGRDENGDWSTKAGSQIGTVQSEVAYNATQGEVSAKITAGDPLGSQSIAGDSGSGQVTGQETHYSPNPRNWGAPL
jgi:hypothetical protein